jgi:hypothetical protein
VKGCHSRQRAYNADGIVSAIQKFRTGMVRKRLRSCEAVIGMKRSVVVASLLLLSFSAHAQSPHENFLEKLDDSTRLEQVCSLEAMTRVNRDKNPYHPDRAIIHAMTEPKRRGDTLEGDGGAFRSGRKWYRFSFVCKADPDHMRVTEFTYRLGALIPEDKWEEYGLYQ